MSALGHRRRRPPVVLLAGIPGNGERQRKAVERYRLDAVKKLHTERSSPAVQPVLLGAQSPGATPGQ